MSEGNSLAQRRLRYQGRFISAKEAEKLDPNLIYDPNSHLIPKPIFQTFKDTTRWRKRYSHSKFYWLLKIFYIPAIISLNIFPLAKYSSHLLYPFTKFFELSIIYFHCWFFFNNFSFPTTIKCLRALVIATFNLL